MHANTDGGLYSQMNTSLITQDSLPLDMHYGLPYPGTLVEDYACGDPSLEMPYYTLSTSRDPDPHTF